MDPAPGHAAAIQAARQRVADGERLRYRVVTLPTDEGMAAILPDLLDGPVFGRTLSGLRAALRSAILK